MLEPTIAPNPYQPPKAALEDEPAPDGTQLASRWRRLGGALLDGLFAALAGAPMSFGRTAVTTYNLLGSPLQGWNVSDTRGVVGASMSIGLLILQWYLIASRGQTLGKIVLGTRIVLLGGRRVGFWQGVGLRSWVPLLVSWVPVAGALAALADALAIFGAEKRCLHDRIAGTTVIRLAQEP